MFEGGSREEGGGCHRGTGWVVGILWDVLGLLGDVGRRLGLLEIDLGCDMGEKVLSLDKGMRELEGEVGGCKEEVVVLEVLHLQQQRYWDALFGVLGYFMFSSKGLSSVSYQRAEETEVCESLLESMYSYMCKNCKCLFWFGL